MYYICQLKDGYMFACVDKGVYRVVNTGYPYPDTPYPADVMLRNMLKALGISTLVKKLDVVAMQSLFQPYVNGEDITENKMRKILTGKTDKPVSTTSAVFFRSRTITVYYISNAKYCTGIRNLIGSVAQVNNSHDDKFLELSDEGIFLLMHSLDESKVDGLRLVKRGTLREFEQFNDGIKQHNLLKDGIDFYEEVITGFETVMGKTKYFNPCFIRMNNQSYREMGETILGYIFDALSFSWTDDFVSLATEVGQSIYADYPNIKRVMTPTLKSSRGSSLQNQTENYIYMKVYRHYKLFSPTTEAHLDRHVRSCLSRLYYRMASSFDRMIYSYILDKETKKIEMRGSKSFDCMRDYVNISNRFKDLIDLILQRRQDLIKYKDDTRIFIGDLLGTNFTSYEQRLFQYVVFYTCLFKHSEITPVRREVGYSVETNWVDRVMPFIYENYKRKYLLGGFSFSNSSEFMKKQMATTSAGENRISKGLIIPDLFRDLELDNFNGRQLTDDEILFLHAFIFFFNNDMKVAEKGAGVYRIKLYKPFFSYRNTSEDNVVTIPKSIQPVLKAFLKMSLLVTASSFSIVDYNSMTPDGNINLDERTISIGELLYSDGVLNSLTDKDFKMTIGESYVSMIMYTKG